MSALQHVEEALVNIHIPAEPLISGSIVIADQHPLFRTAIMRVIATSLPGFSSEEVGSFDDLCQLLEKRPDIAYIVFDLGADTVCNFAGLLYLRAEYPDIPVLVISAHEDIGIAQRCLALGVAGYLPKSAEAEDFSDAITSLTRGQTWLPEELEGLLDETNDTDEITTRFSQLTSREIRVLILLCEGLFNREIADRLAIAEATVKAHVSKILGKLGVFSRTQAVIAVTRVETEPDATVATA